MCNRCLNSGWACDWPHEVKRKLPDRHQYTDTNSPDASSASHYYHLQTTRTPSRSRSRAGSPPPSPIPHHGVQGIPYTTGRSRSPSGNPKNEISNGKSNPGVREGSSFSVDDFGVQFPSASGSTINAGGSNTAADYGGGEFSDDAHIYTKDWVTGMRSDSRSWDPMMMPKYDPHSHSAQLGKHGYKYTRSGLLAPPTNEKKVPALYRCVSTHPFRADKNIRHLALRFLTIRHGDLLDILSEAGHPSTHENLPIETDGGKDCMLVARDERGNIGWALASFLLPLPPTVDLINKAEGHMVAEPDTHLVHIFNLLNPSNSEMH